MIDDRTPRAPEAGAPPAAATEPAKPRAPTGTAPTSTPLPAGAKAPQFELARAPDAGLKLADLKGKPVILAFYPADWSPVCGDELALFNEVLDDFRQYGAELLGISVDGVWCHNAYAKARNLRFPLLSDFEPKGAVARAYGAYRAKDGFCERALFVIDGDGVIRWSYISPLDVNPGADGVLEALDSIATPAASSGAPS